MANKLPNGKYECSYCHREFSKPQMADSCRDNHDLIYIPISRNDLGRLIQFLLLKNDDLITPTLYNTLNSYMGGGVTLAPVKKNEMSNL